MYRQKILILITITFLALFNSHDVKSQNGLLADADFFHEQLHSYNAWLKQNGLNKTLRVDSINVRPDKLQLFIGSRFNDSYSNAASDSFRIAWDFLKRDFERNNNEKLEERLLSTFAFQMETNTDSVELYISGRNTHLFSVIIKSNENIIDINEKIAILKGAGNIIISEDEINSNIFRTPYIANSRKLKNVRKAISNYLIPYYETKGALWYSSDVEIIANYEHKLIFEVTDLNYEILHDIGYFEYIRIEIKVERKEKNIEIYYNLQGKYGSGIFLAPRKSGYKSMDVKYHNYISNYEEKLKSNIKSLLEN